MMREIFEDFLSVPWIQDYILRSDSPLDRIDSTVTAASGLHALSDKGKEEEESGSDSGNIRRIFNRRTYSQLNFIFHDELSTIEAQFITDYARSRYVFCKHVFRAAFDHTTYKIDSDAIRKSLLSERICLASTSPLVSGSNDDNPANRQNSRATSPLQNVARIPHVMKRLSISDLVHRDSNKNDNVVGTVVTEMSKEMEGMIAPKKRALLQPGQDVFDPPRNNNEIISNISVLNKRDELQEEPKKYWNVVVNLNEGAQADGGGAGEEVGEVIDVDAISDTPIASPPPPPAPKRRKVVSLPPPPAPNSPATERDSSRIITPREEQPHAAEDARVSNVLEDVSTSPRPVFSSRKQSTRRGAPTPPPRRSALRRNTVVTDATMAPTCTASGSLADLSGKEAAVATAHAETPRRSADSYSAAYGGFSFSGTASTQAHRRPAGSAPNSSGTRCLLNPLNSSASAVPTLTPRPMRYGSVGRSVHADGIYLNSLTEIRRSAARYSQSMSSRHSPAVPLTIDINNLHRVIGRSQRGASLPLPVIPRRGRRRGVPNRVNRDRRYGNGNTNTSSNNDSREHRPSDRSARPPFAPRATQEHWKQRRQAAEENFWRPGRFSNQSNHAHEERTLPPSPAPLQSPLLSVRAKDSEVSASIPKPTPVKHNISHLIHDNVNEGADGAGDNCRQRISMMRLLN